MLSLLGNDSVQAERVEELLALEEEDVAHGRQRVQAEVVQQDHVAVGDADILKNNLIQLGGDFNKKTAQIALHSISDQNLTSKGYLTAAPPPPLPTNHP
jgi:hypothetical protein